MGKVLHCCDIVVVGLKHNVRVDVSVRRKKRKLQLTESTSMTGVCVCVYNAAPECVLCCLHLTEACLVRLEEQPVHVGKLNFIVVKEEQL